MCLTLTAQYMQSVAGSLSPSLPAAFSFETAFASVGREGSGDQFLRVGRSEQRHGGGRGIISCWSVVCQAPGALPDHKAQKDLLLLPFLPELGRIQALCKYLPP